MFEQIHQKCMKDTFEKIDVDIGAKRADKNYQVICDVIAGAWGKKF